MLRPGEIELTIRNDGPDAVDLAQVTVNDAFVPFDVDSAEVGRLGSTTLTIPYPWVEGEAYAIGCSPRPAAPSSTRSRWRPRRRTPTPAFFGLMALLGIYVGVIPVSLGMLWLPFVRRIAGDWLRVLIAFTIGLLAFLAVDAALEGLEIADEGPGAFGGTALVFLGALVAYLALSGVDAYLRDGASARGSGRGRGLGRRRIWRCWSRSASACTTSARGWRSARPTPSARSRSAPSWWSASRSTTPPRGWRSSRRWPTSGRAWAGCWRSA